MPITRLRFPRAMRLTLLLEELDSVVAPGGVADRLGRTRAERGELHITLAHGRHLFIEVVDLQIVDPDASEEEVSRAAKIAGIHDFIASLPEGYETEIGEEGVKLSEGQKQRLALARAMVKDPDILVLDEPTSALDSQTEKTIFLSLPSVIENKTLFVVAHRLSTIMHADRIFLLDQNRLIAIGTHESLLQSNDYYRSIVSHQQVQPDQDPPGTGRYYM